MSPHKGKSLNTFWLPIRGHQFRTLNIMLLSGHMSNANALNDLTNLAFCPNLWWNSFDQHWLLAFCHLSFDEHLSWKHRDDILTNSCHIISSLVGTVSNIVRWSDDQRIYSGQVCKFGRRATVSILPKLYHLSSGFNNLEGKPLSFSVHQMIKEHILVMSPTFDFGPLSQSSDYFCHCPLVRQEVVAAVRHISIL